MLERNDILFNGKSGWSIVVDSIGQGCQTCKSIHTRDESVDSTRKRVYGNFKMTLKILYVIQKWEIYITKYQLT